MIVRFLQFESYMRILAGFITAFFVALFFGVCWLCVYFYSRYKKKKNDSIRKVDEMFNYKHFEI